MNRKKKIGFSVVDLILILLIAACVLTSVFGEQIRRFLGRETGTVVEYTFLIENVTEEAMNHPETGEMLVIASSGKSLGVLLSVEEKKSTFQNVENADDQVEILTLTCKASVHAEETEQGYRAGDVLIKPGATFSLETPTSSFAMVITMVKAVETEAA